MNIYGGIDFHTPKQQRLFPRVGLNIDEVCVCVCVCVVCMYASSQTHADMRLGKIL